jgi:ABC-2 type transport system ATP-binding protein
VIEIERLSKRYGDTVAVDGLSLRVGRGEFFCFLGPNGAGKTTTIKVMTGLLRPNGGRILIGGNDIERSPEEAKRLLGYVPDQPHLYERLTVSELMRLVAGLYDLEERGLYDRIAGALSVFEIDTLAGQLVGSLSHGMRQKLSFALNFLHGPEVLVVDEPWVGLDPRSIRHVKNYLKEETRRGLTVFMSTHTLSIAEEVADRIGIINHGRLLALGTVAEIKGLASQHGTLEDVFIELTGEDT